MNKIVYFFHQILFGVFLAWSLKVCSPLVELRKLCIILILVYEWLLLQKTLNLSYSELVNLFSLTFTLLFFSGWSHSYGAMFWELCCCANIADESSTSIFWSASPRPVRWEFKIQHSFNILALAVDEVATNLLHATLTWSCVLINNLDLVVLFTYFSLEQKSLNQYKKKSHVH